MKRIYLIAFALTILTAGCSRTIKDPNAEGAGGGTGSSEDSATESIYGEDIGTLGVRPEGFNPEDADYAPLSVYTVYFGFDSFSIGANERGKLENVAKWMFDNPSDKLLLAGHTDSRGTTQYNLGLGERRSISVRDYLIGLGVSAARLHTISYGEEKPQDTSESEGAWAKNRRVQMGLVR